jgi:hypothetical protein
MATIQALGVNSPGSQDYWKNFYKGQKQRQKVEENCKLVIANCKLNNRIHIEILDFRLTLPPFILHHFYYSIRSSPLLPENYQTR